MDKLPQRMRNQHQHQQQRYLLRRRRPLRKRSPHHLIKRKKGLRTSRNNRDAGNKDHLLKLNGSLLPALLKSELEPPMMNRNVLYFAIALLAVTSATFGYQYYQERQKTTGIEISVGDRGISIDKK